MNILAYAKKGQQMITSAAVSLFVLGSVLTMGSYLWYNTQTEQTQWYLAGLTAYTIGDDDTASTDFDRSLTAYQSELSLWQRTLVTVRPSLEQAHLALFHKAQALAKMGNGELAVSTYKDALTLVTDDALTHSQISQDEEEAIRAERKVTVTDLEMLFRQRQDLAKKEGKGQGDGNDGKEKQSDDPSNGNAAGKDNRDAL